MSIFSKIFKKKNKNENIDLKDHNDICEFLNMYEKYIEFINKDEYISKKDTLSFYTNIKEKISYLNNLNKSNLLQSMCLKTKYEDILAYIKEIENMAIHVENHNDKYIEDKKKELKDYLDKILYECDPNILLDDDQRNCVLSDEDYSLIIAGAGAGKTTTIAAKVKYLVDIKKVKPEEILIVSFTNKAVNELKERINQQLKINCQISTFHSTGIDIIKKDSPNEKLNPAVEGFMYCSIRDYLSDEISKTKSVLDKLIMLFGSYFEAPFEEGDLRDFFSYIDKSDFSTMRSTLGDFNQQIIDARTRKMITIQDERVKSKQEVQIANFLYLNNIDYTYEPTYPFYLEGSDKIYTPDFLIKQGDKEYYIEHFALSQRGTNSRFSDDDIEKYKKAVNDKIKHHRKHHTNLIYTWSQYDDGKDLLCHLKEDLIKAGFSFNQKSSEEIFEKIKLSEENKYIARMVKLICTFISNYKVNGYDERHFSILKEKTQNIRTKLFLEIAEGAYLFYEQRLKIANKVDFSDMINESAKLLMRKASLKEQLNFKYIFVDEYQDISRQRFDLTKALSDVCDAKIIAVGDDWQSIYAFSGSDISLFTQFKEKMGYAKELKIVKTYRNPQEVIDIAGRFVQENQSQIKKELISPKHIDKPVIIYTYNDDYQTIKEQGYKTETHAKAKLIEDAISRVIEYDKANNKKDTSILLIGRYNYDGFQLGQTSYFNYNENTGEVRSQKYPNVKLFFMTAHSSKGLGYDNVIIINAVDALYGFPAQLQLDPVLQLVIKDDKSIEYAEERRLFYVAMTRTKNRVFIVAPETRPSRFILELQEKYENVTIEGKLNPKEKYSFKKMCPICGYPLQLKYNKNYGLKLYICTNEPEVCEFMTNDIHGGKVSVCKCDKCNDGFLIIKQSTKTNNYFLGCSNYKHINCTRQMSFQEYFDKHNIQSDKPIILDYSNKIVGERKEHYQNIETQILERKNQSEENLSCQNRFQEFYNDLLKYRDSNTKKGKEKYYVLPEEVLYNIYLTMPLTMEELSRIKGLGEIKLGKYGDDIISLVNKYLDLKSNLKPEIIRKKDEKEAIGMKWTQEEEKQLIEEFSKGIKISEIAKKHSRTSGGIRSRLKKLGLIE